MKITLKDGHIYEGKIRAWNNENGIISFELQTKPYNKYIPVKIFEKMVDKENSSVIHYG